MTTASAFAAQYTYDAASIARVDAHTGGGSGSGSAKFSGAQVASASPHTEARGTSTTRLAPVFATESGVSPTVGELRASGASDAHHIIQDAAARDIPGYKTGAAPGIQLEGPSTEIGSPHYEATQVQRTAGVGGTFGAERQVACMSLAAAGCSPAEITDALARSDAYFVDQLGLSYDSPMRIPGNRAIR